MRKHSTKYRYYHLYTIATAATTRSWIAVAVVLYGAYNYCKHPIFAVFHTNK